VVAIAMLVLWFSQALCDASTEAFILQQKRVTRSSLNSAWTLDLILKLISFLLIFLAAPIFAKLKGQPELTLIIQVTGLVIVFESLKNPILMIYKRKQRYGIIVKLSVYAKLFGLCISIPTALIYKNYWSIILATVLSEIFLVILTFKISKYRPSLSFSNIPKQWNFSKWLIPRSILGYFRNHIDTLLVSGTYGASELGAYNNMKYFAAIPMLQFLSPIVEPLHVELGQVQDDKNELKYQSDITFRILSLITGTIVGFLYLNSKPIVALVLGEQWIEFHKLFSYFSLLTLPFILLTQSFRLLMVANVTNYIFYYELISTTIIGTVLFLFIGFDIESFVIFKVIFETILSLALYTFSYKKILSSFPYLNISLIFSLPAIYVFLISLFLRLVPSDASLIISFAFITLFSALFLTLSFMIFYLIVANKRERRLFIKIINSLLR